MRGNEPRRADGRTLLDSVLEEQETCWLRGERPTVEGYLAGHPTLQEDAEAVVDLIYQEYLIRRRLGEPVEDEEYVRRFPAWSDALIRQFAVDEAMRPAEPRTVLEPDGVPTGEGQAPAASEGERSTPLPAIDGYEMIDELGRGGMGIVYKARDLRLGRIVAIKRIAESAYAQPAQLQRFLAEAELVARLRHANIVAIHAIGQQGGRPFLSLEFAEGGNLAQRLARGPISARQAAELVEALACAVGAAHLAGIIHRDLKPSNVLLTADDVAKISDFGLAKLLDDESVRTLSGEVMGTPSYMAPEQAEGHSRAVGPAADIYALGAILYQALVGRPPFLGGSAIETLKLVATTEVVPPRRQRPEVPRDLETICLKCLEKEPGRRYAGAAALTEDLRRFMDGRPIAARPVGAVGRLGRWGRRNPTLAGTTAALVLAFALGTPTLFGLWLRARADHTRAESERHRAETERDRAERSRDRAISAVGLLLRNDSAIMLSEELRPYRKALIDAGMKESVGLVQDLEGDPRAEIQRAEAYIALAKLQHDGGDPTGAASTIGKAVALAESLLARDPSSARARRNLAASLHVASVVLPDESARRESARRSDEVLRSLPTSGAGVGPDDRLTLTGMNHYNAGDEHWARGRPAEALTAFFGARAAFDQAITQGDRRPMTLDYAARNLIYLCRILGQERLDESLAAGHQAETTFQTLVRDHPDEFEYAWQLSLAQEELGLQLGFAGRWREAVPWREAVCQTLQQMGARHGNLVSRMARIQERIAAANSNLVEAYRALDPAKYTPAIRRLTAEAHEICDKLSLVQPLPWNLRIVRALALYNLAEFQAEDGLRPDLERQFEAERLWKGLLQQAPTYPLARANLAIVRRRIAQELSARGRPDDAVPWDRGSLETVRGDPDLLYEVALIYAQDAGRVGQYPTKLDARQLRERRRRFAADAVAMLRQAVADGFHDAARFKSESLFDPIRSDPDFRATVADLEFPADPFAPP